jgi:integral membrane sensor domain MASE1
MFKCKPERNPKQAVMLVVSLAVLSCVGFLVASSSSSNRLLAQLIAVIFLLMSIMLVIRYTLTEIEYTVSPAAFVITKTIGGKSNVLCTVDLTTAIALVDKETYQHSKDFSDVAAKFNFCQNIRCAKTFVFVFMYKDKKSMIEFEPNEVFVKLMKEAIENAKNGGDNKDAFTEPKGSVIE